MFQLDPASLIFASGLISLAMAAVLLVSRIGLGAEGRGIRSWVLGDLLASLGRLSALAAVAGFAGVADPNFPAFTSTCFLLGAIGHLLALRRAAGRPDPPLQAWGLALALALLFYLLASHTDLPRHRMRWLAAAQFFGAVITLFALRPLLRSWGARLIAGMMVLVIAMEVAITSANLLGVAFMLPPDGAGTLPNNVRPIMVAIDIVIAIFITGGFMLLLQERLRSRIERLMVTDALTGTLNRHGLMPQLARALAQSQRSGRPMSVVMFDLDHFKRINDLHGHAIGDRVLVSFADRVGAELRGGDTLGRWGGEEFLLLMPDTSLTGAVTKADRLRTLVDREPLAEGVPRFTVSGGVASVAPQAAGAQPPQTLAQLLDRADKRLYLAKQRRNCVVGSDVASCAERQTAV